MERRSFSKPNEFDFLVKVVLIGDASVGKSSLMLRYVDDTFEDNYICTIGVDFKIKTFELDGRKIKFQIWDTAGQERFRPITNCYFRGAEGCIACFDITSRESFENVRVWINDFREQSSVDHGKNVVLIGNKSDLAEIRTVSVEEAQELADRLGLKYIEASAKIGDRVSEVFLTLTREIMSRKRGDFVSKEPAQLKYNASRIELAKEPEVKKSKCC